MTIACAPCPTCCTSTINKKPVERVPLVLPWAHRLTEFGGSWILKSVQHTVKTASGASLEAPQYDPTATYADEDEVSFGPKLYTADGSVSVNTPPLPTNAHWVEGSANPHLFITLDTDKLLNQWIDKKVAQTYALAEGGTHDTDYRVEVMATFRDCEGAREIQLWDCVLVKVAKCD